MNKEKIAKIFHRAMVFSVIAERIHGTLKEYSSSYSDWFDEASLQIKKKLGLSYTLEDEIKKFLNIEDLDEVVFYTKSYFHIQLSALSMHLYGALKVDKVIVPPSNHWSDLSLEHLYGRTYGNLTRFGSRHFGEKDIRDCLTAGVDFIQTKECSSPYEIMEQYEHGVQSVQSSVGLGPIFVTFAEVDGVRVVLQLCDYSKFICLYRTSDADKLSKFFDDLQRVSQEESALKGLVCSLTEPRLVSEQAHNGPKESQASTLENLLNSAIAASSNDCLCVDFKASKDLIYSLKSIDYELFNTEIKNLLVHDLPGFISQMDTLCEEGYDARRSYLLEGPPGTGKSYIIKAILASLPKTFTTILIEKSTINRLLQISRYSFLFPALVVIEDVDLLLDDRERRQTLLNFLDGVFAPQKMLTVMTSNNLTDISNSIKARPGRVDRVINVSAGNDAQRRAQLSALSSTLKRPLPLDRLVEKTPGFTVAQLREVVRRARFYTKDFDGVVSEEAIQTVLEECACQTQQV